MKAVQRVRLRSVPLRAALVTGAWAGFVPGLFTGAIAGTVLTFVSGAALEWMRELSFTTGIQQQLLPFGDRIGLLQTLQDGWPVVIPVVALALGLASAIIGMLTAALVALSFGTIVRGIDVEVETITPAAPKVVKPPEEYRRAAGDS